MTADRVHVTFLLPSFSAGGAERVLITLMNGLDPEKFAANLVGVIPKGELHDLVKNGLPVEHLGCNGVLRSLPRLWHSLKRARPSIVVSTMAHMNFTALLLKPFFPKTVFIVREAITPSYILNSHPLMAPFLKIAYKILYRFADIVICPSQIVIDEFIDILRFKKQSLRLLYNPVNTDYIHAKMLQPVTYDELDPKKLNFVASGRLHPQKGFDRLINGLKKSTPPQNWHLHILGEGEERGKLEELINQSGLQDKITLHGHAGNPWKFYRQADYLLLPSRSEGMPNVALESLACGTDVVAMAEAGGIAEIADMARSHVQIAPTMEEFMRIISALPKAKTSKTCHLHDNFSNTAVAINFRNILLESLPKRHYTK